MCRIPKQTQAPSFGCYRALKGELKWFFLLAQSSYWPQTKTSFNRHFSPKSPKVGQKSGQRVQNWPNKNQVASDLLRESTDSVLRATEGIHQICHLTYWGNFVEILSAPKTLQNKKKLSRGFQKLNNSLFGLEIFIRGPNVAFYKTRQFFFYKKCLFS